MALLSYGAWSGLRSETGETRVAIPALANGIEQFETVTLDERGNGLNRETKQAKGFVEDLGNGVTLEMIEVPEGSVTMRSNDGDSR